MAGDLLRCLAVQLLVVLVVAQAVEPSDFERENSHHDIGELISLSEDLLQLYRTRCVDVKAYY